DRAIFPTNAPLPEPVRAGRPTTDEVIRRVLEHRGLREQQIVRLEGDTTTTAQDLEALNRYLVEYPESRVAVVTSHYHTRRTRLLLNALLGEPASRVSLISAPTDGFSADDWWLHDTGFFAISSEYLKLAYCLVRHTRLPWYAAAFVAGCCLLLAFRRHRNSAGLAARRARA
ncbi:MAG: YdcF family protein, partial [Thermoguttaceae bacterium]